MTSRSSSLPASLLASRNALLALAGLSLSSLSLTGCGGDTTVAPGSVDSGGDGGSGGLAIVSCSLGCAGSGAAGFSCAINEVYVNQEISVEFNKPIDPASLNALSFRIVSETGSTPSGEYAVDPTNNRRAIFRPLVTFGSDGLPKFGLNPLLTYTVEIPAFKSGQLGFFITSTNGAKNSTALSCDVIPSLGVDDVVAGPPVVTPVIEELDGSGDVFDAFTSPTDVAANSRLRFTFNDVMNPATLVNTVTSTSDFIEVRVDLDGDLTDSSDQLEIQGTFTIEIDQGLTQEKSTTVLFTPGKADDPPASKVFPKSGSDPLNPRRIVVVLPPTITDLGGKPLANAGELSFTTEASVVTEETLAATFVENEASVDVGRTSLVPDQAFVVPGLGAGEPLYAGRLLRGLGGGSGRLGDVKVLGQTEVVLSTGPIPTVFGPNLTTGPVVDDMGTPDTSDDVITEYHVQTQIVDGGLYPADWATNGIPDDGPGETVATIADGVFEFSSLEVEPGGRLKLVGDNAARIFVRGNAKIRGAIQATGSAAPDHVPALLFGGEGGVPGPSAGAGGGGGDRNVLTGSLISKLEGGLVAHNPGATVEVNGQPGEGRGGAAPVGPSDFGAGAGGDHVPATLPGPDADDLGGIEVNSLCISSQVGVPGAGASYAVEGGIPLYLTPTQSLGVPTTPMLPVPSSDLLRAFEASLDPDDGGTLVGGAGGGGGGMGVAFSKSNGVPFNCSTPLIGPTLEFLTYADSSGAGGGGGGGAVQIQVGNTLELQGSIALSGGAGGDMLKTPGIQSGSSTAPGGGGSGGTLLAQAFDLAISNFPGVLDVRGGDGGFNDANGSTGGVGSPGIVHLENSAYLAGSLPVGVSVDDPITLESENGKVAPTSSTAPGAELATEDILAVGDFNVAESGVGATVGFQSCWLLPQPGAFEAEFEADGPGPEDLGWDIKFEVGGDVLGSNSVVSYRGDPGPLAIFIGAGSLADFAGNELATPDCGCTGSEIVVRFQGARFLSDISDPCNVDLSSSASPILQGSVTPWLATPTELNTFWESVPGVSAGLAAQRRPNMVRVQVLIDGDKPLSDVILSVVEVTIGALTD